MLLVHSAIAQDFAPIGAEWYYTERHAFSGDITFLKISSIKDTIVNQKNCRILQKLGNPMCSGRPETEIMYREDSVVYFWDTTFNAFQILYDFTKNVGEFWIIEVLDIYDDNNLDTIKTNVDSVSIIEINEKSRKILEVTYYVISENHPEYPLYPFSQFIYRSKIIEKIGDLNYLFNYYPYSS